MGKNRFSFLLLLGLVFTGLCGSAPAKAESEYEMDAHPPAANSPGQSCKSSNGFDDDCTPAATSGTATRSPTQPELSCEGAKKVAVQTCGNVDSRAIGTAIIAGTLSQGLQNSKSAAIAASGQALTGGTAAAMTYSAANRCMSVADTCIKQCGAKASDADTLAICQNYKEQAQSIQYLGMAQGASAALSGINAYNNLAGQNQGADPGYGAGGAAITGGGIQPLNMAPGGEVSPSLPNPTNGMAYNKIDGASTGAPASGESSGSGGIGGGAPYPGGNGAFGGSAGGGGGASPLNNPTLGLNGGSGGGGYNVSGVPLSNGGGGGAYRSGGSSGDSGSGGKEFDLSQLAKFLPGQERAPASEGSANAALQAQGITQGMGYLSNFEKVSRLMSLKQAKMIK